ncbi:SGNH/GDSL hydrolase family protein [Nonomuraea sp. NPDC050394]|uniref:SGNH/GDSL hydrolase family protein n=1 Tax=Nonomuraea sp. NPDC050394 TaxID=3364363 RepID=UPI0037B17FE2
MRGLMHGRLIAPAALMMAFCSGCGSAAGETAGPDPTPVQQKSAPVLMFVGDSFTVGSGPVPTWSSYAAETARLLGWQPVIAGAGGTGYINKGRVGRSFQDSFDAELSWRPAPDLLVISGGHNDRRWPVPGVRRAAATLLWTARARWPETRVVMVGPIWLADAPPKAYAVRDALAEVAAREGVTFLDPLKQRWVTGRRSEVLLPDGVHPTFAGHARLARWLSAALGPAVVHQGP